MTKPIPLREVHGGHGAGEAAFGDADLAAPEIPLGFSVPEGAPVAVPLHHMVVCGLTQLSGKTTTLEALIERSGRTAVAFRSKPSERSFADAMAIPPYFREQCDWEYVQDLLEASLQERLKFERSWIIRACKGARNLADVHEAVRRSLKKARGLSESVYTNLDAYFDKVLPELAAIPFSPHLSYITRRLSVMDVSAYRPEVQALIVRSVIGEIAARQTPVIVVLPEAWSFLPQGRGNPVKRAAERLVRTGAASGKFLWLDTQDITGCDKTILKSIDVWLLGRQRERNEIRRMLDQIPASAKPRAEEIATLGVGQFFACFGRQVVKTYVQPRWVSPAAAKRCAVAAGVTGASTAVRQEAPEAMEPRDEHENTQIVLFRQLQARIAELEAENQELRCDAASRTSRAGAADASAAPGSHSGDIGAIVQAALDRLRREPEVLELVARQKRIVVKTETVRMEADGGSMRGRIARLILAGFLDEPKTGNAVFNELKRLGARIAKPNVYTECKNLAEWGFLTIEADGFQAVPGATEKIEEEK